MQFKISNREIRQLIKAFDKAKIQPSADSNLARLNECFIAPIQCLEKLNDATLDVDISDHRYNEMADSLYFDHKNKHTGKTSFQPLRALIQTPNDTLADRIVMSDEKKREQHNAGVTVKLNDLTKAPLLNAAVFNDFRQSEGTGHQGFPYRFAKPTAFWPFNNVTDGDPRIEITPKGKQLKVTLSGKPKVGGNILSQQVSFAMVYKRGRIQLKNIHVETSDIKLSSLKRLIKNNKLNLDMIVDKLNAGLPLFKFEKRIAALYLQSRWFDSRAAKATRFLSNLGIAKNSYRATEYQFKRFNEAELKRIELILLRFPNMLIKGASQSQLEGLHQALLLDITDTPAVREYKERLKPQLERAVILRSPKRASKLKFKPDSNDKAYSIKDLKAILKNKFIHFGSPIAPQSDLALLYVNIAERTRDITLAKRLLNQPIEETGWRRIRFLNKLFQHEAETLNPHLNDIDKEVLQAVADGCVVERVAHPSVAESIAKVEAWRSTLGSGGDEYGIEIDPLEAEKLKGEGRSAELEEIGSSVKTKGEQEILAQQEVIPRASSVGSLLYVREREGYLRTEHDRTAVKPESFVCSGHIRRNSV